jgi:hypothetical protein
MGTSARIGHKSYPNKMEHVDATKIPEFSMNFGPMRCSYKKKNNRMFETVSSYSFHYGCLCALQCIMINLKVVKHLQIIAECHKPS